MKLRHILLILFAVSVALFFYGCSKEEAPIQAQNVTIDNPEPPENVQVIVSCDDADPCTQDIFNELSNQCEHREAENCCGDDLCEAIERCDVSSHKTACPDDCPRECPAFISVGAWSCEGSCRETEDEFFIDGNAKLKIDLANIGERPVSGMTNEFRCSKSTGSTFVSNQNNVKEGVTFRGYFNDGTSTTSLVGEYVDPLRSISTYYLEITGSPESQDLTLNCFVGFKATAIGYDYRENIKLKLLAVQ